MNGRGWGGEWIVLFSQVIPFEDNVSTILSPIVNCKAGVFCSANDGAIGAILDIALKMAAAINVPLSSRSKKFKKIKTPATPALWL